MQTISPGFLTDTALVAAIEKKWIAACRSDATSAWRSEEAQIQPSSIDVYADTFFTPEGATNDIDTQRARSVTLKAGAAVLIYTKEHFALPGDVMGLIFAPTRLSLQGLFSPTVGHIDPGYNGPLKIVGINLAKDPLHLRSGEKIATVLLYKLNAASAADHGQRKAEDNDLGRADEARAIISRMAADFGNFREQAKEVAREERWKLVGSLMFSAILIPAILLCVQLLLGHLTSLATLKEKVTKLEATVDVLLPLATQKAAPLPGRPPEERKQNK